MVNSSQFLINDYVCFGLFEPLEGLRYNKWFSVSMLLASFFEIIVNWIFFTPSRYYLAFWVFFISGILLVFRMVKKIPGDLQKFSPCKKSGNKPN